MGNQLEEQLCAAHVYTPKIAVAASLIAVGAKLRARMPITATTKGAGGREVVFWFDDGSLDLAGKTLSVRQALEKLVNPWPAFGLSLEHPLAYLKAQDENRQVLLAGVKTAEASPFKVIQRGNRVMVIPPGMTEAEAQRLYSDG